MVAVGLTFEWDPNKASSNLRKHGVSFAEATTVFDDSLGATVPNPVHSIGEERYLIVGMSNRGRLLIVAFVERNERIRIISARRLTLQEQRQYEEL